MKVTVKVASNNGAHLMAYRNDKNVPINNPNDGIGYSKCKKQQVDVGRWIRSAELKLPFEQALKEKLQGSMAARSTWRWFMESNVEMIWFRNYFHLHQT